MESTRMEIPPLSYTFCSAGFINPNMTQGNEEEVMVHVAKTFGSLSIDMVEVEDQGAKGTRLPTFPKGDRKSTRLNSSHRP